MAGSEALKDFTKLVEDVWVNGLYGVDIGQLLTAFAIFALFYLMRNLFSRLIIHRITKLTQKTTNEIDDAVVESLAGPMRFIPVVMGVFFGLYVIDMDPDTAAFAERINKSLIAFTIFWALYSAAKPIGLLLHKANRFLSVSMIDWLAKLARVSFAIIGGATILEMWGIEVGPLVAGLGLFGVAVALGAQDLFKNLIAGIFVIGEQRFQPGDWILVDGVVEGTVEHVGFRTTTVRRFDKAPVYVPNARLSDNAVTNFSRMTYRRIRWVIGIEYSATSRQLQQIRDEIEDFITDNPDYVRPEETSTFVRIDEFSASSVDIMLYCFTRTTNWLEWLAIKEQLLLKIKRIVEDADTGFAFPSRTIYIEAVPGDIEAMPKSIDPKKEVS